MSSEVTVNELARELGLPASVLLEECHRLGIDAGWAGGTLTPQEAHVLRGRLSPTEGGDGPMRRWPPAPGAPLPQRRAGGDDGSVPSRPGTAATGHEPGPLNHADDVARGTTEVSRRSLAERGRRFDDTARTAAIAAIVGVLLLLLAPVSPHVLVTIATWCAAVVAGLVAVVAGNRSRYKISTHPERFRGMAVAATSLVVGILVLVAIGLGTWAVVRSAPASEGPTAVTARADVGELRWTYQRLRLIAGNGWNRPAKDAGTCWRSPEDGDEPRTDDRVERTYDSAPCRSEHDAEVLGVFALDPEADAPYPGSEELIAAGERRCAPIVAGLPGGADGVTIVIEYPTEAGWDAADHDVVCVAMATRRGSLTDVPEAGAGAEAGD